MENGKIDRKIQVRPNFMVEEYYIILDPIRLVMMRIIVIIMIRIIVIIRRSTLLGITYQL